MKAVRLRALILPLLLAAASRLDASREVLGTATSAGPVSLSGDMLDEAGIISWPVFSGDELATASAPAMIITRSGGRVIVGPGSKLKVDGATLVLLEGRMFVACARQCGIVVRASDHSLALNGGDRVSAIAAHGTGTLTRGAATPQFAYPPNRLLQELPYTWGIHLPEPGR